MAGSVKIDKRALDSTIFRVRQLNGTEILTGFFEEDRYGPENDSQPVANVAWINERGAGMQVPSRPFMETTFSKRGLVESYVKLMAEVASQALTLGRGENRILGQLGDLVKASMQKTIQDWTTPPNSESWAAKKGRNDPLVFTGHMLNSVKSKIRRN
jgi:hypothetical protein